MNYAQSIGESMRGQVMNTGRIGEWVLRFEIADLDQPALRLFHPETKMTMTVGRSIDFFRKDWNPVATIEAAFRNLPDRLEKRRQLIEEKTAELKKLDEGYDHEAPFPELGKLRELQGEIKALQDKMAEESREQQAQLAQAESKTQPSSGADVHARASPSLRKGETRRRVTLRAAQKVVDSITRKWSSKQVPRVFVVNTGTDLPQEVRRHLIEEYGYTPDYVNGFKGLYWRPDGQEITSVYIVADQHESLEDVRRTLAHEVVGHFSMIEMLGDQFDSIIPDILAARSDKQVAGFFEAVEKNYDNLTAEEVAEEVIARMAEERVVTPIMVRVIAAVRRFLRSLGFNLSFGYNEIMDMIMRADRRLRRGTERRYEKAARAPEPDPPGNYQLQRQFKAGDWLAECPASRSPRPTRAPRPSNAGSGTARW